MGKWNRWSIVREKDWRASDEDEFVDESEVEVRWVRRDEQYCEESHA